MKQNYGLRFALWAVLASGCSTQDGNWGGPSTLRPGWHAIGRCAKNAAMDPHTWMPLIAAGAFVIDDHDQRAVDWAARHNPLFGSIENAKDASDALLGLSTVNYAVTVLAVPSGPGKEGLSNKARGAGFGALALGINSGLTNLIKSATDRERPDSASTSSFPSLHTSSATISGRLAARNIDHMPLSDTQRRMWQWSSYTAAGLTGWARVEGKRHHPSDVLVGYALGNFLGAFLNDAFITPEQAEAIEIIAHALPDEGVLLGLGCRW